MSVSIIFAFLPWIVFDVIPKSTHSQMLVAMLIALAVTIATNYKSIKKLYILPCATLLFFMTALIAVLVFNFAWIATHIWIATNSMCALIAWGSLAIKQPFTIQYAKEQVAAEHWNHPLFLRINNLLTAAWGIIFLFNLMVNLFSVELARILPGCSSVLTNGSTVVGIWLCAWFPRWYTEHLKLKHKIGEFNESTCN